LFLQRFELAKAGLNQLINAVGAGMQPQPPAKNFFGAELVGFGRKLGKLGRISGKCN